MALADFSLQHPLRVRWAEVDLQAIVFNGHYLTYFDIAITEYWRACNVIYPQSFEALWGCDFFVVKATVEYHASARYDEELLTCARVVKFGNTSMRFVTEIHRGADHLISGELVYVCVDPKTRSPVRIPDGLREIVKAFEKTLPAE